MGNKYTLRDNQIIVNPNTDYELNLTEEGLECDYCEHDPNMCGYYKMIEEYGFCDNMRIVDSYEEVFE